MLEGMSIPVSTVPEHHCHDTAWPVITCFRDSAERDADIAWSGTTRMAPAYAVVYVDADYGGGSIAIVSDYPNLGTIGWNNKISSFTSPNGGHPKFWDGANYGPPSWQWAAGASVAYVGDSRNDKFSSMKNVP